MSDEDNGFIPLSNMSKSAQLSFRFLHPELIEDFKEASRIFSGKIELAQRFVRKQPLYYDKANLWWIWNSQLKCWEMTDEVDITNLLHFSLGIDTINSKERNEIIQALKQVARLNPPKEIPNTWIQFKDKIFDIESGIQIDATSDYFTINPIAYSLHKDNFFETPTMDKIFTEWVGRENIKMLYQIIAYCLIADYPIHRLFCFVGAGLNGKGCFLRLVQKFIGRRNCCSTELDSLLSSRFEVTRLHKKLICLMGETNFNEISKTSILKKLTGEDLIGFEYKNKTPFEEKNYAKILIATNSLPETTDKTIGFYRRWLIIDFPNGFSEERNILADIPEEEYESLATKCALIILPELIKERKFSNEGSIEDRQKSYENKSNPFDKFYADNIEEDSNSDIPVWEFAKRLNEWCKHNRFREMIEVFVNKKMRERNIQQGRVYKDWYENNTASKKQIRCWLGIKWKAQ